MSTPYPAVQPRPLLDGVYKTSCNNCIRCGLLRCGACDTVVRSGWGCACCNTAQRLATTVRPSLHSSLKMLLFSASSTQAEFVKYCVLKLSGTPPACVSAECRLEIDIFLYCVCWNGFPLPGWYDRTQKRMSVMLRVVSVHNNLSKHVSCRSVRKLSNKPEFQPS